MRREVQDSIIILAIFTHTPTKSCLNIGRLNDWAGLAPQLLGGGSSLKAYRSLRLWPHLGYRGATSSPLLSQAALNLLNYLVLPWNGLPLELRLHLRNNNDRPTCFRQQLKFYS